MDSSFARNMDLGGLFRWLLPLAAIGLLTVIGGVAFGLAWLIYHLQWV